VTIDQQAALQGYTGVRLAADLMNGVSVKPFTQVDVLVVDAQTLTKPS
jgi:ABC-type sugar transport system substrate-binding protein